MGNNCKDAFAAQFKPILRKGNPIREIGKAADTIANRYQVPVIRLHLGNPSTEQFEVTKLAMVDSVLTRQGGYGPHPGSLDEKERLAHFFNDAERLPGHFKGEDAIFFPGATLITKSIIHIFSEQLSNVILLSKPGYPVYENQALADCHQVEYYRFDENGLLDYQELKDLISKHRDASSGETLVRLIFITYPHNPTGKTLNQQEAKQVADVINRIHQAFPNIIFYNDSVYSATCAKEMGYHSFYTYLSDSARLRTITGASGAKLASMGGERIGGIATKNPLLQELLANAQSQMAAGVSVHSISGFLATTELFLGQWMPGIDKEEPRAKIADFYQTRIDIITNALFEIDQLTGLQKTPMVKQKPVGGMYLYADFTKQVKGKAVPEILRNEIGSDTIETGEHWRNLLLNMHRVSYIPVSTVNGEIFGEEPNKITLRISCVERDLNNLALAVNTFKGAFQLLLGIESGAKPSL